MMLLRRKVNGEVAYSWDTCDSPRPDNKPSVPQPPLPRLKRQKIPRRLWETGNAQELRDIERYFDEFASRLPSIVNNKEIMKADLLDLLYDTFDHTRKLPRDVPPHD